MQTESTSWDIPTSPVRTFGVHLGVAGTLGLIVAQASILVAGLVSAALGTENDRQILHLDPLVFYCALLLAVWVVATGVAFSLLERSSPPAR